MIIVGIDPGKSKRASLGVSVFTGIGDNADRTNHERYELADTASFGVADTASIGGQWRNLASSVAVFLRRAAPPDPKVWAVVFELPHSRGRHSPVPPDDLIGIASAGAFVAGYLQPSEVKVYSPREWKGSLDGDTFIRQRIAPALSPEEFTRVDRAGGLRTSHEWDATGLVLHYLGRLGPRRVFPR